VMVLQLIMSNTPFPPPGLRQILLWSRSAPSKLFHTGIIKAISYKKRYPVFSLTQTLETLASKHDTINDEVKFS
jgi:hypothetical protein